MKKFKSKVDRFLELGEAKCIHHGVHSEWTINLFKQKIKNAKIQTYRAIQCKKCIRERTKKWNKLHPTASDDYRFSFKGVVYRIVNQARARAKHKKLPIKITPEWVFKKLIEQDYKCAYSGMPFDFSKPKEKDRTRLWLPSIDQRIAGNGYTEDNCVLVCGIVNLMKNELELSEFITLCGKIHLNNIKI